MSKLYSDLWTKAEEALVDPVFNSKAEDVLEACYLERVFPTLRANLNGHHHLRVAATLVLLSETEAGVRIDTRDMAKWNGLGLPSVAMQALNKLAEIGWLSKDKDNTLRPTGKLKSIAGMEATS